MRVVVAGSIIGMLFALPAIAQPSGEPAPENQPTEPSDGVDMLARGRRALLDGDPDEARAAFELGLTQLDDGPTRWPMLLGLALAHELGEAPLEAVRTYRRFLLESRMHPEAAEQKWRRRREKALGDIRRLEPVVLKRMGKVEVTSEPAGARLVVDGEPTGLRAPAVLYLLPGDHEIRLELEDFAPLEANLTVTLGERARVERKLAPRAPTSEPAAVGVVPRSDPRPKKRPPVAPDDAVDLFVPGGVALAFGGASLVAAIALNVAAISTANELEELAPVPANQTRERELREDIRSYQGAFVATYIIGGLGLATGATLMVWEVLAGADASAVSIRVSPQNIVIGGRF